MGYELWKKKRYIKGMQGQNERMKNESEKGKERSDTYDKSKVTRKEKRMNEEKRMEELGRKR